ncbi:MAG: rod shape-determining protein, partial [Oscillospiraceae bacterium]
MAKLDIGIDLGTTSILIYTKNKGIVLNEPSVIATNTRTGKVIAVGKEAYEILGKTPDFIKAVEPLANGVISDYEAAQKMIKILIEKV